MPSTIDRHNLFLIPWNKDRLKPQRRESGKPVVSWKLIQSAVEYVKRLDGRSTSIVEEPHRVELWRLTMTTMQLSTY
jgi:hypothetical protein